MTFVKDFLRDILRDFCEVRRTFVKNFFERKSHFDAYRIWVTSASSKPDKCVKRTRATFNRMKMFSCKPQNHSVSPKSLNRCLQCTQCAPTQHILWPQLNYWKPQKQSTTIKTAAPIACWPRQRRGRGADVAEEGKQLSYTLQFRKLGLKTEIVPYNNITSQLKHLIYKEKFWKWLLLSTLPIC